MLNVCLHDYDSKFHYHLKNNFVVSDEVVLEKYIIEINY